MSAGSTDGWFFQSPQGNLGPYSLDQLRGYISQGSLTADHMVWRDGMATWMRAGDVPELAGAPSPNTPSGAAPPAPNARDDHLDGIFIDLVKDSWRRHKRRQVSTEVDEVLVGAMITATLDNGFALIDLESTGTNHYLRFEELSTGNRIIFRLNHQAEALITSQVLGHEADVTIGFGRRVKDFGRVWAAVKQELKGGYIRAADPGIMTVDGDISSQYIYVEVGMLWDINDYLAPDNPYQPNYPKLTQDVGATIHALGKYLHGRLSV